MNGEGKDIFKWFSFRKEENSSFAQSQLSRTAKKFPIFPVKTVPNFAGDKNKFLILQGTKTSS
jgi:hypothetical protein